MENALFLQSVLEDPYALYATMLAEHPVRWDQNNALWAIYSYAGCQQLLTHALAYVPNPNVVNGRAMNVYAVRLAENLVRVSNPPLHAGARQAAEQLFGKRRSVQIEPLLKHLLEPHVGSGEVEWVNAISKKLPAMVILKGFGFAAEEIEVFLDRLESLTLLMLPNKTTVQMARLNTAAQDLYQVAESYYTRTDFLRPTFHRAGESTDTIEKRLALYVSNLLGLLIQSYDAGRGVLSNALWQLLRQDDSIMAASRSEDYLTQSVIETLRFDPPIHNTRRVLLEDVIIDGTLLKQGQTVLLVIASANRDPQQFAYPHQYNIHRENNGELLTFGTGIHQCLARHFSVGLASRALGWLLETYPRIRLLETTLCYEPMINARLPRQIRLSLA